MCAVNACGAENIADEKSSARSECQIHPVAKGGKVYLITLIPTNLSGVEWQLYLLI